jgi:hypothetical protein
MEGKIQMIKLFKKKEEFHPVHGDLNPPQTSHVIWICKANGGKWGAKIYNPEGLILESSRSYDTIRECRVELMHFMHALQNANFRVDVEDSEQLT